jgi:hypothetical protein
MKMEKECCNVKFIETDNGFKIEVTGMSMKEAMSCCCMPMGRFVAKNGSECCPPKEDKK